MNEKSNIKGTARPQRAPVGWLKRESDKRPCGNKAANCKKEGLFIPNLTVWASDDPERKKPHAVIFIDIVLCGDHATQDPSQFVPDEQAMEDLRRLLGTDAEGNQREPDLDSLKVRYIGNTRCRVERSMELTREAAGRWVRRYNNETGKLEYVKDGE